MLEVLLPFLYMKSHESSGSSELDNTDKSLDPLNSTVAYDGNLLGGASAVDISFDSKNLPTTARSIENFSNQVRQIQRDGPIEKRNSFDLACVYAFFKRFVKSFIPNNLHNKFNGRSNELPYLGCCLRITDLLLSYTDMEIASHLKRKHIQIEMYGPRLVTTLYSRVVEFSLLYELWEIFLFERDKYFIFYFAVGMLMGFKSEILKIKTFEELIVYL